MWTRNDFAALDQVTTGEMRKVYQAEEEQKTTSTRGRHPLQLTGLSITIPCQGSGSIASLSLMATQTSSPSGRECSRSRWFSSKWKAHGSWLPSSSVLAPAHAGQRCAGKEPQQPRIPSYRPAEYTADLARALDHAATGTPDRRGGGTVRRQLILHRPGLVHRAVRHADQQDRAGGITITERFSPAGYPTLALPLAGGRGFWLIGILTQTAAYSSAAGIRKDTLPDGASIAVPRPSVVHHETDTYITTYTALDPPRSAGGFVALNQDSSAGR